MNKNITIPLLIVGAILFRSELIAQKPKTGTVIGTVMDDNLKVPLPFVTVFLTSNENEDPITGQITNEEGFFRLKKVPYGAYVINVQFIGFKNYSKEVIIDSGEPNVDLGRILMKDDVALLGAVEVTAERSTIEQKVDRKVINIGKDLSTVGPTAADLMINLPSIDVDQDGNLSMRGNDNVIVLVDGKPTNQSASQLLQQIPSGSIKAIELITNPSAKFIPEGMSGIINIVLHKNTNSGFNGNLNTGLTLGNKLRYNTSTDLNYRTKKINYYFNYALTDAPMPTWGEIFRPEEPSEEDWYALNDRVTHLFKGGLDIELTDRTVVSVYSIQNFFKNAGDRSTDILFPQLSGLDFGQAYQTDVSNYSANYNLDLRHRPSESSSIELEVDHGFFHGEEMADFQFYGSVQEVGEAMELITNNRHNTTINLDFEQNFDQSRKFEIGLETRIQQIGNGYDTSNPNFVSSSYVLDRDIYAGYFNYRHNFGKWSYQFGARLERFDQTSDFTPENEASKRHNDLIQSIYPSLFINFVPDPNSQKHAFNLSVSRRVDRPNLQQLNPMRAWSSARVTNIGNPSLVPQFTNSIELNYTKQLNSGSLTSGLFVRKIFDEITRFGFNDPDNSGGILFSYDNYQDNTAYGVELSGNYQVTSIWSFNSSFDLYSQTQRGVAQDEFRQVQNVIYNFRTNHSVKLSDRLTLQVIGLFHGGNTNLQYKTLSFYFLNLGARYQLFDGNGNFSISFNDIFHTQRFAFKGGPIVQEGTFNWDSRTLFVGYTHKLGRGKKQSPKRKKRDLNEKKSVGGF